MNTLLKLSILLGISLTTAAHANEIFVEVPFYLSEDETLDDGVGVNLGYSMALNERFNVFGSAGWGEIDSETINAASGTASRIVEVERSGDFTLIPLRLGLSTQQRINDRLKLTLLGAVAYNIIDSDLQNAVAITESTGPRAFLDPLDVDDIITGEVGLNLDINITDSAGIYLGGGYILDIDGGDISTEVLGKTGRELELEAVVLKAGINIIFN